MSKLPQADELTPTEDGIDPTRVEKAFATFADRVRELESVASELRAELQTLRAERAAPSRFEPGRFEPGRFEDEDWPVEARLAGSGLPPADWVATVPPPLVRGLTVPRLAIEGAFLLVVAVLAGLADLGAGWIVLVMAVAWALVALAEWAAAAKRSRWRLDEIAPAVAVAGTDAADSTGPWDMPVVEATAIESQASASAAASESNTIVTTLPADPEETEPEAAPAPEQAPRRRFGLRRRKQPAEAAADPWEA